MASREGNEDSNPKGAGSSGTQNMFNPIGNINPIARITVFLFNGKNYKEWSYSARLANGGAKRLGYRHIKELPKEDPNFEDCESENMLLMNWILNSMEPLISKSFSYCKSAHE